MATTRDAQRSSGTAQEAALHDKAEDGRRARGRQTRTSILEAATDLASIDGLEGLSIGRLASVLGMSKSGLFAHFGSKEELQLATNATARERFTRAVIAPAREHPPGRERLDALVDGWIAYLRGHVFPGGCYFCTVRAEFDSRPPGPIRDAIVEDHRDWLDFLARTVRGARDTGELAPTTDPEQLAFEIESLGMAANVHHQLYGDTTVFDRAATGMATRIEAAASGAPRPRARQRPSGN